MVECGVLDFFYDGRLELHGPEPIDLAVDVVAVDAVDQTDVAHLGADLDGLGLPLDLQVLDDGDGIAVGKHLADGILDNSFLRLIHCVSFGRPFVGALGANQQRAHFVCIGA